MKDQTNQTSPSTGQACQIIAKGTGIQDDEKDSDDRNTVTNFSFPYRSPDWDFHSQVF